MNGAKTLEADDALYARGRGACIVRLRRLAPEWAADASPMSGASSVNLILRWLTVWGRLPGKATWANLAGRWQAKG